jgi:hypothetical protein
LTYIESIDKIKAFVQEEFVSLDLFLKSNLLLQNLVAVYTDNYLINEFNLLGRILSYYLPETTDQEDTGIEISIELVLGDINDTDGKSRRFKYILTDTNDIILGDKLHVVSYVSTLTGEIIYENIDYRIKIETPDELEAEVKKVLLLIFANFQGQKQLIISSLTIQKNCT